MGLIYETRKMEQIKLLGICCNWSPYACYNAAGMNQMKMPPNFGLVRVMCIGRINQALILRAFEYGADGVILLECNDEDCRYGPGPGVGHENVARVRKILKLLGIGQGRLVERSFAAHEREELVNALWEFDRQIREMGPNPAKPTKQLHDSRKDDLFENQLNAIDNRQQETT